MNLTERTPSGRLSPMAACMQLWSGAVSVTREADGTFVPLVHADVVSLYGSTAHDVEACLGDLSDLLAWLEADDALAAGKDEVAPEVVAVLAGGRLTGGALCLLQQVPGALMVEEQGAQSVSVRYDTNLARGVADLDFLLCRMVWQMRAWAGVTRPVTVSLSRFPATAKHGIETCAQTPDHAHATLPSTVRLTSCPEDRSGTHDAVPSRPALIDVALAGGTRQAATDSVSGQESDSEEVVEEPTSALEATVRLLSDTLAIEALERDAHERMRLLKAELSRAEARMPVRGTGIWQTTDADELDLPTTKRAARSLVIHAVIWLAIGLVLIEAGRHCIAGREVVAASLLAPVDHTVDAIISSIAGSLLGEEATSLVGSGTIDTSSIIPTDSIASAVRIAGIVLITIGIALPTWRILRHRRRLSREVAMHRTHVAYMSALTEQRQAAGEAAFASALATWQSEVASIEDATGQVSEELTLLAGARLSADAAIGSLVSAGVLERELADAACAMTVVDYLAAGRATDVHEAIALFAAHVKEGAVSADPARATDAQPTLRAARDDARILSVEIAAAFDEGTRLARIDELAARITGRADSLATMSA